MIEIPIRRLSRKDSNKGDTLEYCEDCRVAIVPREDGSPNECPVCGVDHS